jgi:Flp pilus assembly protein TadG
MNILTRLRNDESGGIVLIFALMLTILVLIIGGFMDYGRAVMSRSAVQSATDAAALAAAVSPDNVSESQIAARYFDTNFSLARSVVDVEYTDLNATLNDEDVITIDSNTQMETNFMRIGNQNTLPITSTTKVNRRKFSEPDQDVVVVADVSGSMQQRDISPSRIEALEDAYLTFVEASLDNDYEVRVGLSTYNHRAVDQFPLTSNYNSTEVSTGPRATEYASALQRARGGTCGACGLEEAINILEGNPAPATPRDDGRQFSERKVVVLMTDGAFKDAQSNGRRLFPGALDEAEAVCDRMHSNDYSVYSIFLGDILGSAGDGIIDGSVNADYETHVRPTLEYCATNNADGNLQYFVAPDAETLKQVFLAIAEETQKIRIVE